jgi:hypothetical protein
VTQPVFDQVISSRIIYQFPSVRMKKKKDVRLTHLKAGHAFLLTHFINYALILFLLQNTRPSPIIIIIIITTTRQTHVAQIGVTCTCITLALTWLTILSLYLCGLATSSVDQPALCNRTAAGAIGPGLTSHQNGHNAQGLSRNIESLCCKACWSVFLTVKVL